MKRPLIVVAYHEAGHAVVAHQLGIRVKTATIVPGEDGIGHVRRGKAGLNEYDDSPRMQRRIENDIRYTLAGHAAQKIYAPRSHYGARADYQYVIEWALQVNHNCDDAARAWVKWLTLDVTNLLKSRWQLVEAVANELVKEKTLNADQIQTVIQGVFEAKLKAQHPNWVGNAST